MSKFVVITAAQAVLLQDVLAVHFTNPVGWFHGKGKANEFANLEVEVYDTTVNDGQFGPIGWDIPNTDFHGKLDAKVLGKENYTKIKAHMVSVVQKKHPDYNEAQLNKDLHWMSRLCNKVVRYDAKTGLFGYLMRGGKHAGQIVWVDNTGGTRSSGGADPLAALALFGIAAATPPEKVESEAEKKLRELQELLTKQGISIEDLKGSSEETPSSEQSE